MTTLPLKRKKELNTLGWIISILLILGLLANAIFYYFWVGSDYKTYEQLTREQEQLQMQYNTLLSQPLPEKVTDEEAIELTKQIPTELDQSRFIMHLRELEIET